MPVTTIYLKDNTDGQLSVDFSSQAVDLFWDDPADASEIRILSDHETRFYNTTMLEYVGFNARHKMLDNANLRRALGLAIDREKIIDEVYKNHAVAAPLILSPNSRLYDAGWAPKLPDPLGEISAIFSKIGSDPEGMKDENNDGYLEIRDSDGKWNPISLLFIVNSENPYRKQVAHLITEALKSIGIDVTLLPLDWDSYLNALQKGNFDLYLGDVSLPADNDMMSLLSPGGALDYGKTGDASYVAEIKDFLGAPDDTAQTVTAKTLCDSVYKNAPIVPILYHQYAVHTNRNVISGIDPSQSSLYYGFTKWKINLG